MSAATLDKIKSRHWSEDGADSTVNWSLEDYAGAWAEAHQDRADLLAEVAKLERQLKDRHRRISDMQRRNADLLEAVEDMDYVKALRKRLDDELKNERAAVAACEAGWAGDVADLTQKLEAVAELPKHNVVYDQFGHYYVVMSSAMRAGRVVYVDDLEAALKQQ